MKFRTLFVAVVLATAVAAPAQTFSPIHKYKEGASDDYTMKMNMTASMGDVSVNMDMNMKVVKVYDNGDADIQTTASNVAMKMGGQEFHPPQGKPTTTRYSKYGMPISDSKQARQMNFGRFSSYFGDKDLTVGQAYNFDQVDDKNPKNHVKGSAKLTSLDAGKATIVISLDSFTEQAAKPMHLDGTVVVDAGTGTMQTFDGTATDVPGGPGMTVSSAHFTITHK